MCLLFPSNPITRLSYRIDVYLVRINNIVEKAKKRLPDVIRPVFLPLCVVFVRDNLINIGYYISTSSLSQFLYFALQLTRSDRNPIVGNLSIVGLFSDWVSSRGIKELAHRFSDL